MKKILYMYENGTLAAIQDVTGWKEKTLKQVLDAQKMIGRTCKIQKDESIEYWYAQTKQGCRILGDENAISWPVSTEQLTKNVHFPK